MQGYHVGSSRGLLDEFALNLHFARRFWEYESVRSIQRVEVGSIWGTEHPSYSHYWDPHSGFTRRDQAHFPGKRDPGSAGIATGWEPRQGYIESPVCFARHPERNEFMILSGNNRTMRSLRHQGAAPIYAYVSAMKWTPLAHKLLLLAQVPGDIECVYAADPNAGPQSSQCCVLFRPGAYRPSDIWVEPELDAKLRYAVISLKHEVLIRTTLFNTDNFSDIIDLLERAEKERRAGRKRKSWFERIRYEPPITCQPLERDALERSLQAIREKRRTHDAIGQAYARDDDMPTSIRPPYRAVSTMPSNC